ncbi:MAG: outer membrane protein assembly factor BamB family protein [Candidatus Geothermincolia bacterium]
MFFSSSSRRLMLAVALCAMTVMLAITSFGCGGKGGKTTNKGAAVKDSNDRGATLEWPAVYRDNRRTGRSPFNGPGTADVRWTYSGGATTRTSWVVLGKDGNALVGLPGKVVSIKAGDGSVAWEAPVSGSPVTSCRVADDGTIYAGAGNAVVALSSSGKQKWSYDLGSTADDPALSADGGTVYVGSTGGRMIALSKNGTLNWEFKAPGNIRSPSIDNSGNLYCSASTLAMYCLDSKGNKKWEFKPAGDLPQYPGLFDWANTLDTPSIADNGTIYAGTFVTPGITKNGQQIPGYTVPLQGKVYAITPQGQLKWEYARPEQPNYTMHTPTIAPDGTLYAGTSCWIVVALDPVGKLLWEFNTNEGTSECPSVYSPPIGKDGLLYAATTNSRIFCITPDGREKWRYDANNPWLPGPQGEPMMGGSNNFTPPAIAADGTLISLLAEGKVFAFTTAAKTQ